ncbi:carbohydrate ABC transporter permease [Alphaproteobacteria bacterium]|jgi:ABC-type glycerol-3-phosphate transport system permease component|nr:carbohydrate ABC transporter permease [Alphaproteobacteria bacterium]MDC0497654.1 carbohydrate ABC transporter permease [Alphaproteobacteria bacterium]MDC1054165.1 carbohydrate ABC transporter permease [Alphaproteobacteria bacterium]|tara:strand:+ start:1034 stop:1855 length:822 start_codon:yes stop_codon:yes gene_type:complete
MKTSARKNITLLILAFCFTFFFLAPNLWMFFGAFKNQNAMFALPPVWIPDFTYIKNFTIMLSESYRYLLNSIIVTIGSTIVSLVFSLPTAFGLTFFKFKGSNFLADWILSTRMLPPVAAAIPLFMLFKYLNLLDSLFALIIVYTAFNIPFAVWVSASFFKRIPYDLIEASRIEGASWFQIFIQIAIPLSKGGIATVAIFVFIFSWNELLIALFFTVSESRTFPIFISAQVSQAQIIWGNVAAATVIQSIPPILLTIFLQKNIVSGLTLGAVKN